MITTARTRTPVDKVPLTLALLVGLMLSGIGFLAPRSQAQSAPSHPAIQKVSAPVASTSSPAPGPSLAVDDDGDGGTELLEHWGDPIYSHEERIQLAGLSAVFVLLGASAFRRRQILRKAYRDV